MEEALDLSFDRLLMMMMMMMMICCMALALPVQKRRKSTLLKEMRLMFATRKWKQFDMQDGFILL